MSRDLIRWTVLVAMLAVVVFLAGLLAGRAGATTTVVPRQVYVIAHDSDLMPNRIVLRYCWNGPRAWKHLTYLPGPTTPAKLVLRCPAGT